MSERIFRARTRLWLLPIALAAVAAGSIACSSTTDGHPQAAPDTASRTSTPRSTTLAPTTTARTTPPTSSSAPVAPYAGDAATVTCSQYKDFDESTMSSVLNSLAATYGPGWKINPSNIFIVKSLCNIWPDKLVKALMYGG
ncbi:hypothetical protein ACFXHA_02750 [Nocardia sp. NPDC059240]|uniref:hypothetical protein n=1 Tax=Nocardia sp. NPDC059240 TaxID=3346786 RepID=UPI0036C762AB